MLYINKIDDKTVSFRIDNGDENAKAARYFADQVNGFVTINRILDGEVLFGPLKFDELTINGEAPTSAADAVQRLNLFFGNFKPGGGSSPSPTPTPDRTKPILFFDHDGTLLHSYTLAEAQALSALPGLPTHDLLTGTGWTHTLEQVKSAQALHVGAMYRTTDGKTYAFVTLTAVSGLALPLYVYLMEGATVRVDWGDGQTQDTSSASSMLTHNYASPGDYVITIERISSVGFYEFGWGTSQYIFVGGGSSNYRTTLTKLYIGDDSNIIGASFQDCGALSSIMIPLGAGNIGSSAFSGCRSLGFVALPSNVEIIGANAFTNCHALRHAIIPRGVTNIGNMAFGYCYNLREYLFESSAPPTLGTTPFSGIFSIRKIYVPDASVEAYKTAPNWATYANYIHPISERP